MEVALGQNDTGKHRKAGHEVSILVFVEVALGQGLFFVLFPVSHCQTALFTPSSEHY